MLEKSVSRFVGEHILTEKLYIRVESSTTASQDVQTRFSVQLAFAKFLSRIKGNFCGSAVSMILALY